MQEKVVKEREEADKAELDRKALNDNLETELQRLKAELAAKV